MWTVLQKILPSPISPVRASPIILSITASTYEHMKNVSDSLSRELENLECHKRNTKILEKYKEHTLKSHKYI